MISSLNISLVIGIAVPVAILLGFVVLTVSARSTPPLGKGAPDHETKRREAARVRLEKAKQAAATRAETPALLEMPKEVEPGLMGSSTALATIEQTQVEVYSPVITSPPDPVEVGISRRKVLNRMGLTWSALGLASFGGAVLAFLIPPPTTGFGNDITLPDSIDDIKAQIKAKKAPYYNAEARCYVQTYEAKDVDAAKKAYALIWDNVKATGLMPLFQKCPHLGCKVPWCDSSQWFECPCHGSQYDKAGEKRGGPAPRGMDRFQFKISGNKLIISTGKIIDGPTIGTDTIAQKPEGSHCI